MLIVASLLKPDAAALLSRQQHHVRRPTPATALTPRQYRWHRRPRASRWCRRCPPVALVALAFVALESLSDKLASERKKLIVESAALASNGDPLIFDAPNELIVGAADIENNSGDASSDTSGGGKGFMGVEEGV
jgi:hypothetical protein